MNKICTTIEQSKKLIELGIDVETADMYYPNAPSPVPCVDDWNPKGDVYIPAWSLTALLELMPINSIENHEIYGFNMIKGLDKNGETYAIKYTIFCTTCYLYLTDFYNNPIDACFEIICWFLENGYIKKGE